MRKPAHGAFSATGSLITYLGISYAGVLGAGIAGVLESRAFGATGYGVISLATLLSTFVLLGVGAGVPMSVLRETALKPELVAEHLGTALWQSIVALPVALAASCVIGGFVLDDRGFGTRLTFVLVVAFVGSGILGESFAASLISSGHTRQLATLRALPTLVVAALIAGLALLDRLTVTAALLAMVAKPLVEAGLASRSLALVRYRYAVSELRRQFLFGRKALASQFAELLILKADQLLVLPLLGAAALGRYAVCATISGLALAANQALIARNYRELITCSPGRAIALAVQFAAIAGMFCVALTSIAVFALPIAYGPTFEGLAGVQFTLVAAVASVAACHSLGAHLTGRGDPLRTAVSWCIGLVALVCSVQPASDAWGLVGVAISAIIGYLVSLCCMIVAATFRYSSEPVAGAHSLLTSPLLIAGDD